MKTRRWMLPLGMAAVVCFLLLTTLGRLLRPGYNPVRSYVSELLTDDTPYHRLMKTLMNLYTIYFCLFCLIMSVYSYRRYHKCVFWGYTLLLALAYASVLGYGTVPISMNLIFLSNDITHLIITIALLSGVVLSLFLIGAGYRRQERLYTLGRIVLSIAVIFTLLNVWHMAAIMSGSNILGLIQRLTFYTFHAFTFCMSMIYTFHGRFKSMLEYSGSQ